MGLTSKTVKGVFWSILGSVGSGFSSILITFFLARLVSPESFGLIEIILSIVVISELFVDCGFSQALIREDHSTAIDLSSVFYLNVFASILLYVLLFFLSPLIGIFYESGELIIYSRILFFKIIIDTFAIIQNVIYIKNLNFKLISLISLISLITAGIVSVIMAYCGFGVWSLVANCLLFSFFKTTILWCKSNWRPLFSFKFNSIKKYLNFGGSLVLTGIIDKTFLNIELLLLGKFFSREILGYFSQSKKMIDLFSQSLTAIIQKVTYPSLSTIKDKDELLVIGYKKILSYLSFLIIPTMLFISASANNFIYVFFGENWHKSIPILRILAFSGIFFPFVSICFNIFLVKGKTQKLLYVNILRQLLRISIILVALQFNIIVFSMGIVLAGFISAYLFIKNGGKLINYYLSDIVKDNYKTFIAASLAAIGVYITGISINFLDFYWVFVIQIVSMITLYVLGNFLLKNHLITEMVSLIKGIKNN